MRFKDMLKKNEDKKLIFVNRSENAFGEKVCFAIFSKSGFRYRFVSFSYDGKLWSDTTSIFSL